MSTYNNIIDNLDRFIRKYYKNRLIKGTIYSVALLLSLFLIVVAIEHFGYFSTTIRTILFWFYLLAFGGTVGCYIVSPLLKMNKLGKRITYSEAAHIIGNYFPEVKDKLLNLLQLQEQVQTIDSSSSDLLIASINQKTDQLSPIPFTNAVNLSSNRRFVKYAAIPLAAVMLLAIISPSFISEPYRRIINHSTEYERPAPFVFVVENASLEASQQSDFQLKVAIEGNAVPNEAFINIDGRIYRMQQQDKSHYTYTFNNIQKTIKFHMQAAKVESAEYELVVYPNPSVVDFQVSLSYPKYTGKADEVLSNIGDLNVPQGTIVHWLFQTSNVDSLYFVLNGKNNAYTPTSNGCLSVSFRALQSLTYAFFVANAKAPVSDTMQYSVSVVPDVAPMIAVLEMRDSLTPDRVFFRGHIKDDYGFSKLEFHILKSNKKDTSIHARTTSLVGISKESSQEFLYSVNLNEIALNPGDKLQYYFEVWDNDAINGPKSSMSQSFEIDVPTDEELDDILQQNTSQIQQKAQSSMSELQKLQEDINELMRKLVDKKDLNWQDKKQLQELTEKQKEVKNMLQKMQEQLKENNRLEEHYRQQNEQIMEKQKELDKLFNEVLNDEMKQMMEEIDKMMHNLDKKEIQEQLENLKLKNDDLEKQLDQNIELMKRLEMEKRVEETIKKTDRLAEKQKELSQKTEQSKSKDKDELLKEQQQLSKEFEQLKQEINKLEKDYKNIDKDINFNVDKDIQDDIQKEQKDAENQLNKGRQKEASQQQKSAAEDMQKLSEKLAEAEMDAEMGELAEDAESIRRLLKNLVQLSFAQEQLITDVNTVHIQDPKYQSVIVQQNKIRDDFRNIEDSLRAIAKRQVNVASMVNKELPVVNTNITKSISQLLYMNQSFYGNSKNTSAARSMQYSMTSLNNLALVMAESLDKMQNQQRQNMQQKKQGNCKKQGSCSKPGNGKPSAKSMKQMQDELNKQMEALKKQFDKQGKPTPGRGKLGETGSMSEEFAKMAARQEQIRRMMQQYGQELKQQNGGDPKLSREIEEMMRQMEQTETDLVNKTITQQTIKRQQQIMTRLLQHEKAEMEREKEQRRQSTEGKDQFQPSQSDLEKYNKLKEKNMDLFRQVPPSFSPYYKSKVDDYFYKL